MSMVINLVEDHNIYLCEGGPVYNGGIQPIPITYLTQWKIVGNSEVHTDPYLTSWKVSGNSVVDNNTILSCGDLGQDGKYHVKISNGVTIYDIPLDAPLRKVNDVADKIEFEDDVATVTRYLKSVKLGDLYWFLYSINNVNMVVTNSLTTDIKRINASIPFNGLCPLYTPVSKNEQNDNTPINETMYVSDTTGNLFIYDSNHNVSSDIFKKYVDGIEFIYELATPTTKTIQVPDIAVSPTDTYTSANVVPYSAFEHTENKEIWSCGEYSAVDGKWHILVQPLGGSIADIALDAPLRKVGSIADDITLANGTATVTRELGIIADLSQLTWTAQSTRGSEKCWLSNAQSQFAYCANDTYADILCAKYKTRQANGIYEREQGIAININKVIQIYDSNYILSEDKTAFVASLDGVELIAKLATPTTELVDAPQIAEADSYSMVISQGAKAVEWSSFEKNSE